MKTLIWSYHFHGACVGCFTALFTRLVSKLLNTSADYQRLYRTVFLMAGLNGRTRQENETSAAVINVEFSHMDR